MNDKLLKAAASRITTEVETQLHTLLRTVDDEDCEESPADFTRRVRVQVASKLLANTYR